MFPNELEWNIFLWMDEDDYGDEGAAATAAAADDGDDDDNGDDAVVDVGDDDDDDDDDIMVIMLTIIMITMTTLKCQIYVKWKPKKTYVKSNALFDTWNKVNENKVLSYCEALSYM